MYCLECAKRGTKGEPLEGDDPISVLHALRQLGDAGDLAARRFFFGILWDEGRSILCYRCKRGRPVRLTPEQVAQLDSEAVSPNVAPTTPSSPVGEKTAETEEPREGDRRAA